MLAQCYCHCHCCASFRMLALAKSTWQQCRGDLASQQCNRCLTLSKRCDVAQSGLRSNPPCAAGGMHVLMISLSRTERSEGPDRPSPLGVSKGASMACALCTCLKRSFPPMLGFVKVALQIRATTRIVPRADGAWNFPQKLQICFGKRLHRRAREFLVGTRYKR